MEGMLFARHHAYTRRAAFHAGDWHAVIVITLAGIAMPMSNTTSRSFCVLASQAYMWERDELHAASSQAQLNFQVSQS